MEDAQKSMDYLTASIISGGILGGTALLIAGMFAGCEIFFRLGKADMYREILEKRSKTSREESRVEWRKTPKPIFSESESTKAEIRWLTEAMVSHSHEPDGSILFRVIPPQKNR